MSLFNLRVQIQILSLIVAISPGVAAYGIAERSNSSSPAEVTQHLADEGRQESDLFPDDKRLSQLVSIQKAGTTVGSLLAILTRDTGVKMKVGQGDIEFEQAPIALFFNKKPLREVMFGVVALNQAQWRQNIDQSYTIMSKSSVYDIYLPKNKFEEERFQIGNRLLEDLKKLSPSDRAKLGAWEQGATVPFGDIPSGLRDNIKALGANLISQGGSQGFRVPIDENSLTSADVGFQIKRNALGFDVCDLTFVKSNVGSAMLSFSNYKDLKDKKGSFGPLFNSASQKPMTSDTAKRTTDKTLDRLVTLNLGSVTMEEAIRSIAEQSGINMVTESTRIAPRKLLVNFGKLSVIDALDRLALTSFALNTETINWAWDYYSDFNLIVFRSSQNPAFPKPADKPVGNTPKSVQYKKL